MSSNGLWHSISGTLSDHLVIAFWRWLATVSVSQNDNYAQCESAAEKAINTAEGTAGGALFRAVNFIADAIKVRNLD